MTDEFPPLPLPPLTLAQLEELEEEARLLREQGYAPNIAMQLKQARLNAINELLLDEAWLNFPGPDPDSPP